MSGSSDDMAGYENFLREKYDQKQEKENEEKEKERKIRIKEFEEKKMKQLKEETEELEKKKEKEIREIRKKREEAQKRVEMMESEDQANRDRMIEALKVSETAEVARLKRDYDEIIQKHMNELKKERLVVETNILGADVQRINLHREFEETKIAQMQKTLEKMDKMEKDRKEKEEAHQQKILEETTKCTEEQINNEKVIGEQIEKDAEKAIQLRSDLNLEDLKATAVAFQTLVLRIDQHAARVLNDGITKMSDIVNNADSNYQRCLRYLSDNLTEEQVQRAAQSFDSLSDAVRSLNQHLTSMKRQLADLADSDEKNTAVEGLQKIGAINFPLSNCIAKFSGRLMMRSGVKNEQDEKDLARLMGELVNLVGCFKTFEARNASMTMHISQTIEHIAGGSTGLQQLKGAESSSSEK